MNHEDGAARSCRGLSTDTPAFQFSGIQTVYFTESCRHPKGQKPGVIPVSILSFAFGQMQQTYSSKSYWIWVLCRFNLPADVQHRMMEQLGNIWGMLLEQFLKHIFRAGMGKSSSRGPVQAGFCVLPGRNHELEPKMNASLPVRRKTRIGSSPEDRISPNS